MKWKYFSAKNTGLSHLVDNKPCQDSYELGIMTSSQDSDDFLVAVVSDGAGSKKHSGIASKYLCEEIQKRTAKWLIKNDINKFNKDVLVEFISDYRKVLEEIAKCRNFTSINEFACTMLFVILSKDVSIFAQIGDGAIVNKKDDELNYIFDFQKGEYINTTHFITDKNFEKYLMFKKNEDEIKQLSIHTDGIENISCDFNTKKPFKPFYFPFFNELKNSSEVGENEELSTELDEFLSSDRVNDKTADDKTVIFIEKIG